MSKKNILDIKGICFSAIPEHIERIFKKKDILFPKILVHDSLPLYCIAGQKFFFYKSHSKKEIVGEGTIKSLSMLTYNQFLSKLSDSFITKQELENYVNNRYDKRIISFKISNLFYYKKPIKLEYYITMGGKYITNKEYYKWFHKNK